MTEILQMICDCSDNLNHNRMKARDAKDWAMPWIIATRLHALLDCYIALGGNDTLWRNNSKVLKKELP